MKKKKSLILVVGLVGLILGSTLLYNVLANNYEENQDNIVEQKQLESQEELTISDATSEELETETIDEKTPDDLIENELIENELIENDATSLDSETSSDMESANESTTTPSNDDAVSPTQGATTPNQNTTTPNQGGASVPEQNQTTPAPTSGAATPTVAPTKVPTVVAPTSTPAPTATPTPTKVPTKVNTAPDFTVQTYSGNNVSLSSNFGKPIVVNFWASWCGPCKSEMPDFNAVYKEYKDKVVFMMVDMVDGMRETKADGYNYVTSQGFSFPVYYDVNQSAAYAYGITSYPTTYFIDANGNVSTYSKGAMSASTLRNKINKLINQ